jgi:hypothetical protein
MYRVSYYHGKGYRVSRSFPTYAAAQEFVDANALVYPLPGCVITDETFVPLTEAEWAELSKMVLGAITDVSKASASEIQGDRRSLLEDLLDLDSELHLTWQAGMAGQRY